MNKNQQRKSNAEISSTTSSSIGGSGNSAAVIGMKEPRKFLCKFCWVSTMYICDFGIGSTNFHTGSDFGAPGSVKANAVDFMQGWLNYQIEHHMWSDMSMLSYQRAAPRVRAICEKYGVPYVQEPVWTRVKKTVDIMTGEANMLNWDKGQ